MTPFPLHPGSPLQSATKAISAVVVAFSLVTVSLCQAGWAADDASIARGGRLFDNWFLETNDQLPPEIHPGFNGANLIIDSPEESWRCVTCHGWDYNGRSDQKTEPISGEIGTDAVSLGVILQDQNHQYGDFISDRDLPDLAAFIKDGLIDLAPYVKEGTTKARGDPAREVALYATICANCHGDDGGYFNNIIPLGSFAQRHPREALHKILNGHPGQRMPPLRFLKTKRVSDLLAYVQTLPTKHIVASIARGGRLYNHWQKETGATPPAFRHQAYPKEASQSARPMTNWRCKECHGWDYKGVDGNYGTGPHRTGIGGIRAAAGTNPQSVIKVLMDSNHRYYGVQWPYGPLELEDLIDLANFVTQGQIDVDSYIDRESGRAKGDPKAHVNEFNVLCAACHGRDGSAMPTGSAIGYVARTNPWETLHVIRNGHPNEAMPALMSLDIKMLVDILAYAQTLP